MQGPHLSEELLLVRAQIRRIIQDDIIPLEKSLDPDAPDIPHDDWLRISSKARAAGLWYLGEPARHGGGGMGTFAQCVLLEEMVQHRMGLYNPGCGVFGRALPPAIWAGNEAQIQKYAVQAIRHGWHTFHATTEPTGGSDPAGAIRARAVRKGDVYVLNGTKTFISHAAEAEWGVAFVSTDPAKGRNGVTCFIIEKGQPGFTARPFRVLRDAAPPSEVSFVDCAVPVAQRVGEEGQGLFLAFDHLTKKRFPYSAANVGVAQAAHRLTVDYANERQTFGSYLADKQAVQWMLADSEMDLRAARLLVWAGAWKADRGEDARVDASMAKLYSSEALGRVIDRCVQIHGGYGVTKEFPFERWYREAR
ncbi:MAG: acyl-CoA dehydrogenase family protein, partial [Candidatus Lambdaproteobacteria bacterium]|nr:acyl-CoA dehydrogenase family protein [Candidatus Lambdaproteobacteria bacterium]